MRRRTLIIIHLAACTGCGGQTPDHHGSNQPDGSAAVDASEKPDILVGAPDISVGSDAAVIDVDYPDGAGPIVLPDGRISWPTSDSAVATPDGASWDAGPGCPRDIPTQGDTCTIGVGCAYPVDCCGIIAGYFRARCPFGTWYVEADPNGELCAPCVPFPQAGTPCSLAAACQSGPPPICLTRSCYAAPVVARCVGDQWNVVSGCVK